MKTSIKKFEGQVIKNADKIKGGNNGTRTTQWFEADDDWSDLYDEIVNKPK